MTILFRIAERALNRPLLIHPDKVPLLLGVLEGRIPVGDIAALRAEADGHIAAMPAAAQTIMRGPAPQSSRFVGSADDVDPLTGQRSKLAYRRTENGVAIIPVLGTLINRGAWLGSNSGETSYEGLKFQIAKAVEDPRTTAIVLDIESPGGEAVGTFEVARAVREANARKPVVAVVNGMAASAAYAIASGAGRIVTTETAISGSIGVVLLHADISRRLDSQGVTPTLIFAGAHKVDGNPFEPLPDAVRADMQAEVNRFYDLFVATVAAGRAGMSPEAIRNTEARVFIGADAVAAGLADSVGTFEQVLADLSRGQGGRSTPFPASKGARMDTQHTEEEGVTIAAHNEAVTRARAEGAAAERTRILGIQGAAFAGQEGFAAEMVADGATTPEAAALRFNSALKAKGPNHVAALSAMDAQARVPANLSAQGGGGEKKTYTADKAGWMAEWAETPSLKAAFVTGEDYAAARAAEAGGRVRTVGRSAAA